MENELFEKLDISYIKNQAAHFKMLENKNGLNKFKNTILKAFGLILIIIATLNYFELFVMKNNEEKNSISISNENKFIVFGILLVLMFFYNIFVLILKNHIIKKLDWNYEGISFRETKTEIGWKTKILLLIISPDYIYSLKSKKQLINNIQSLNEDHIYNPRFYEIGKECKKEISNYTWLKIQIERKFLVEWNNWNNIIWSTILFFLVILLCIIQLTAYFNLKFIIEIKEIIWFSLGLLVVIRIFSRGIEIVIAFYKDVVRVDGKMFYEKSTRAISLAEKLASSTYYNGFRFTLLKSQARLSLAIHTLLEFCILFSSIYIILSVNIPISGEGNSSFLPIIAVLHSFSVSVFNVSFDATNNLLLNIFHVIQILISGVLILLSISQYLNGKNDLKEETFEYKFYKEVYSKMILENSSSTSMGSNHSLGKKTIFCDEGIEMTKAAKNYYVFKRKYSDEEISIKLKKGMISSKEKLIIEHNNKFSIIIDGDNRIKVHLVGNV